MPQNILCFGRHALPNYNRALFFFLIFSCDAKDRGPCEYLVSILSLRYMPSLLLLSTNHIYFVYICVPTLMPWLVVEVWGQLVGVGSLHHTGGSQGSISGCQGWWKGLNSDCKFQAILSSMKPCLLTSPCFYFLRQRLTRLHRQVLNLWPSWSASWVVQDGTIYYAFKCGEVFAVYFSLISSGY